MEEINISYFSNLYDEIRFPIPNKNTKGLRSAQLGAIHSICAYDTLELTEPVMIVMPTGSGKTTVIMMAPYLLRKDKVLIVTPNALVRHQIFTDYSQLRTLKEIGVVRETVAPPKVYEANHLYDEKMDEDIVSANVVIATHKVAESISKNNIKDYFDYIIIDEAHHVPAKIWQNILNNMKEVSSLLVTATPFRLDKKNIKCKLAYNYPLSMAVKDGIFGKIEYIPAINYGDKDLDIALTAEEVFLKDRNDGYDHYLMVRTNTQKKAKYLEKLYSENTKLKLEKIDSSLSSTRINDIIRKLFDRKLDGIICVDMLGEGFDFPNLKIAAIHDPHKSLASTLQFVGRFARTNKHKIGSAKFIAVNDEELKIENQKLYTENSIWQNLIVNISEERINKDIESQEVSDTFNKPNLTEEITLDSIRIKCHAKVYRVKAFNINGMFPEKLNVDNCIYRSIENNTIVGISKQVNKLKWCTLDTVNDISYNLYVIHYQTETGLAYIYSSIKTDEVYMILESAFFRDNQQIPRSEMNRVLAGYTEYIFYNTGMQNRQMARGESYRTYIGSNTANSIDETTGRILSAGHAFCRVCKDDDYTTIGYSSGSKVWSFSVCTLAEYLKWCDYLGKKISNPNIRVQTNTNFDKLPQPNRITSYDEDIISAFFSEIEYSELHKVKQINGDDNESFLADALIKVIEINRDNIKFSISINDVSETIVCNTDGEYTSDSNIYGVIKKNILIPLDKYFCKNPLQFLTSENRVFIGCEVYDGDTALEKYDIDRVYPVDWELLKVDIRCECGQPEDGKKTIQEGLKNILEKDDEYSHIIFDHGSGEVADYIAVKETNNVIVIELYHCKGMK